MKKDSSISETSIKKGNRRTHKNDRSRPLSKISRKWLRILKTWRENVIITRLPQIPTCEIGLAMPLAFKYIMSPGQFFNFPKRLVNPFPETEQLV